MELDSARADRGVITRRKKVPPKGFLTIVGIFAYFASLFIGEVFASPTQTSIWKGGSADFREEVLPSNGVSTPWPGAAVIYRIQRDVGCPTSSKCKLIMDAMEHYEEHTCIRFKERSGERDFVDIIYTQNSKDCYTYIGRTGGAQTLSLGTGCWHRGDILHELGHSVGLPDEVTRPDRDEYIEINFDNMTPKSFHVFKKQPVFPSVLKEPFDYHSIMMYGHNASGKSWDSETIIPKRQTKPLTPIWDKKGLSQIDVRKISALYRCQGTNQNPSFPFDVKCSFDDDMCGFRNLDYVKWTQRRASYADYRDRPGMDGYLLMDFENAKIAPARVISVNFHGLSPLDRVRGPNGCVSFSYYISSDKTASLKLSILKLNSPHQLDYGRGPTPLWAESRAKVKWTSVFVPVDVEEPFSLVFQAQFERGATEGAIGLDDFGLSYSPCTSRNYSWFSIF